MDDVQTSGKYTYKIPAMEIAVDYTKFLTEYLSQDQKWKDLFNAAGEIIKNETENPINQMLRLRDAASCPTAYQLLNNRMLGFNIPTTGYSNDESYRTMKTLGNFYITRQASFAFLNYLSFIKNTLLEPVPLWAQSVNDSVDNLIPYNAIAGVIYTPTKISVLNGGSNFKIGDEIEIYNAGNVYVTSVNNNGEIETYTTSLSPSGSAEDMAGEVTTYTTSGSGTGASFLVTSNSSIPANYFPTVYYDVFYDISEFTVDEAVIKEFITALQPAHLVFRQFEAYAGINLPVTVTPILQIFSYTGASYKGTI